METTIPSYLTSRPSRDLVVAGHQQVTLEWWESRSNHFSIFISQFVIDEASAGDQALAQKRLEVMGNLRLLDITLEVTQLAQNILASGVIPKRATTDAAHIAVAAVHRVDYLMTWNCAHIANAEMALAIKHVCGSNGFECPIICTPEELMGGK